MDGNLKIYQCCLGNRVASDRKVLSLFHQTQGDAKQHTCSNDYRFSGSVLKFFVCTLWVQLQPACTSPSLRSMATRVQLLLQLLACDLASLVPASRTVGAFSFRHVLQFDCGIYRELKETVPAHSMEAYSGCRVTAPLIINLGTRWS